MQKCKESLILLYLMPIGGLTAPYQDGFIWSMTMVKLSRCPSLERSSKGRWWRSSYATTEGKHLLFLKLNPLLPIKPIFLNRAFLRVCATKKTSEIRHNWIYPALCPNSPSHTSPMPYLNLSSHEHFSLLTWKETGSQFICAYLRASSPHIWGKGLPQGISVKQFSCNCRRELIHSALLPIWQQYSDPNAQVQDNRNCPRLLGPLQQQEKFFKSDF